MGSSVRVLHWRTHLIILVVTIVVIIVMLIVYFAKWKS